MENITSVHALNNGTVVVNGRLCGDTEEYIRDLLKLLQFADDYMLAGIKDEDIENMNVINWPDGLPQWAKDVRSLA